MDLGIEYYDIIRNPYFVFILILGQRVSKSLEFPELIEEPGTSFVIYNQPLSNIPELMLM